MTKPPHMRLRLANIPLSVSEGLDPIVPLTTYIARQLAVSAHDLSELAVCQRALDARHQKPRFQFTVEFNLESPLATKVLDKKGVTQAAPNENKSWRLAQKPDGPAPIVVGAGPASEATHDGPPSA